MCLHSDCEAFVGQTYLIFFFFFLKRKGGRRDDLFRVVKNVRDERVFVFERSQTKRQVKQTQAFEGRRRDVKRNEMK